GKSAVRWIRANADRLGVDPDRIAAGGGSAGGHVAAAAGICNGLDDPADDNQEISSKANALLLFNPVYDNGPEGYGHDRVKPWFPAISPAHNISADDPPTIVFLGTRDNLIPVETAERFDAALKAAGIRSELWLYPDQPHGFFNESKSQESFLNTVERMDAFLVSLGWLTGPADKPLLRSLLTVRGKSHPWPFSNWATPENAEGFRVCRAPLPAAADYFHSLLTTAFRKPNVVVVLCDDLGYGDVHCLNPEHGKIATPHADALAAQGMVFSDAHSGSSVCTPTRYGLLTGRYAWRTKLQQGVVQGFAPSLISENRPTLATFLREHGYATSIVGKWHLNFQYVDPGTSTTLARKDHSLPPVASTIPDGPLTHGFDRFYGFHHARDMQAVIENDRVIAHRDPITMLPGLTREAVAFITAQADIDRPFFLYLPLSSPHTPIVPSPEWQGKSGLGDYADFVMQTDAALGVVMEALKQTGQADNTLLIFTSDNGCSKAAGIEQLADAGHRVSGDLRGSKADLWDGGHRIPFILRWPERVAAGSSCEQTICLTDLFATMADLLVDSLPPGCCEDSVSFLPALSGQQIPAVRQGIVHHSISGHFGYRSGPWKLLLCRGSGGWSAPNEKAAAKAAAPAIQLYDMHSDLGEQRNLADERPEVVAELLASLKRDVTAGRSTAGRETTNDVTTIELWKSGRPAR
ncbi:MAG: sulfatase-like hydrolase/transferase, partial [Pirellulales bacterium]|nr:sulfatase-like hydrolase/transferase [Pirellulales bacterium]